MPRDLKAVERIEMVHEAAEGCGVFRVYAMKAGDICEHQAFYIWHEAKGRATQEGTKAHAKREAFKCAFLWQDHAAEGCKLSWDFPGAAPRI